MSAHPRMLAAFWLLQSNSKKINSTKIANKYNIFGIKSNENMYIVQHLE